MIASAYFVEFFCSMSLWNSERNMKTSNRAVSASLITRKARCTYSWRGKKPSDCVRDLSPSKIQQLSVVAKNGGVWLEQSLGYRLWNKRVTYFFSHPSLSSSSKIGKFVLVSWNQNHKVLFNAVGGMLRHSLNSVVTQMQKAPQTCPVHVASAEQQQKEKLSDTGKKMVDRDSSAFPSVEDLNNPGPSFLIFLLSL